MRKNLVLDLDNTLISAEALTEFPFHQPGMREKAMHFPIHDMDGYYIVFERPGLQLFLDYAFQNYDVTIWTAASKDYALFIVDRIILQNDPERKLENIFFAHHCDLSRRRFDGNNKDLRLLWETFRIGSYDPQNTIIVDDLDEVRQIQPENAVRIHPFEILDSGSEHDRHLEELRTTLRRMFAALEKNPSE